MVRKTSINLWQLLLLVVVIGQAAFAGDQKVRILILSGSNNHNWQQTTPVIKNILTGAKISADVTEKPASLTGKALSKYDVIVSNWNNLSDKNLDWSDKGKQVFLDFVRKGGGHVMVHAGGSSFYDWAEYHKIVASWGATTGHGPYHAFVMNAVDTDHPICADLNPISSAWTEDELWRGTEFPAESKMLVTAFSSSKSGGDDGFEPVLGVHNFGDGRCVNFMLGHDAAAMQQIAFKLLLTRSVQWAAGQKELVAVPENLPRTKIALYTNGLTIDETLDANIKTIASGNKQRAAQALKSSVGVLTALRGYRALKYQDKFVAMTKTVKTEQGQKLLLSIASRFASEEVLAWTMVCFNQPQLKIEAATVALEIAGSNALIDRKIKKKALYQIATANLGEDMTSAATMQMYMVTVPKNLAIGAIADSPDDLNDDGASKGDMAAIDGDVSTYWDEQNDAQLYRLRIKLSQPETVRAIQITGHGHHLYSPKDFSVLLDDKAVKTVTNAQYYDNDLLVLVPETKCSMIELKITGYYGLSPAIRELAIYPPIQPDLPDKFIWKKTDSSVALMNNSSTIWQFNYGKEISKSCFHPVSLIDGTVLTDNSPADHFWHHALWFAWKDINGVNFWEENLQTGQSAGEISRENVKIVTRRDHSAKITMDIAYNHRGQKPILAEKRKITVSAPSADGTYYIDWTSEFKACSKTDVKFDRTPLVGEPNGKSWGGYAGFSVRLNGKGKNWTVETENGPINFPGGTFRGKAKSMDYSGVIGGQTAGIAILDNPNNLNAPSPWYAIYLNPMKYFSPAVICYEPYTLPAGESFKLSYRIIVHPQKWDADILKSQIDKYTVALLSAPAGAGQSNPTAAPQWDKTVPFPVNYPGYMSKHDAVYLSPPMEGYEGFPLGNGDLGAMVWATETGFRAQINKNDTWEPQSMVLRSCGRLMVDFQTPCHDWLYLDDFEGRLSMHKAQADFSTETPFLKVSASSRVQANRNVFVFQCRAQGRGDLQADGGVVRISLQRWGSRAFPHWYHTVYRGAHRELGSARAGADKNNIWLEEQFEGLSFALACRVIGAPQFTTDLAHNRRGEISIPIQSDQNFTVLVAAVTSNESPEPLKAAIELLDQCQKTGLEKLQATHQSWWSDYWKKSFVHIGNDYLENLYYMHSYVMGSSSRGMYPMLFNAGLFNWNHDVRQWVNPHNWNQQQSYWSVGTANHIELMRPYLDTYWRLMPKAEEFAEKRGFKNTILWSEQHDFSGRMVSWGAPSFVHCFTPASQIGQLFWQYYLYTEDEKFLAEKAYPFMKKAAEFYLQYLQWDKEKKEYFIFPASPYESEQGNQFRNTTSDLAAIRASFRSCIQAGAHLDVDPDKRVRWQHVLDHLAPYPRRTLPEIGEVFVAALNSDGSIPEKLSGSGFCRNTASVFPTGDLGLAQKGSPLFEAAVRTIKQYPKNDLAINPQSVVKARLGMGEAARDTLLMSIRQLQHFPQGLFYNINHWHTLSRYADVAKNPILDCQRDYIYDRRAGYGMTIQGQKLRAPARPFIQCGFETSAILATAINEMLLQSHEGVIRVFPAVPNDWPATFTLKARGGFVVSANKPKDDPTDFVLVKSVFGNKCRLANPWPNQKIAIQDPKTGQKQTHKIDKDGVLGFETAKDGLYLISPVGKSQIPLKLRQFDGQPNVEPKYFKEATLGKPRNF